MPATLRPFAVLLLAFLLGSCQGDHPIVGPVEGDSDCTLELQVVGSAVSESAVLLELIRGDDWSDRANVEWKAFGPGKATFSTDAESRPVVVFDSPGTWTLIVTLTQSSRCGVGHAATMVDVAEPLSECGILLERALPAYRNEPLQVTLRLGPSRDPSESARWNVTGSGDVIITVGDSTGAQRAAEIVFPEVGSYRVEVEMSEDAGCAAAATVLEVEVRAVDQNCISGLLGPSEVETHEVNEFRMVLGSGWSSSTVVEWSVGDRARVVDESGDSWIRAADVVFDRPGDHTVRAVVRDATSECGSTEHTKSVFVPQGDCGVNVVSTTRVHVGAEVYFSAEPDADWAFEATSSPVEATWTIVEGPTDGIEIVYASDGFVMSSRRLRFQRAGTYVVEVEIEDAEFGDGYVCPTWSERIEIEVIGPPTTPVPLGEVALAAPASGRVFKVSGEWPAVAFGTYGTVLIATERGTDAVDLLTGQPLLDVRRLSGTALTDPPRVSMVLGPGSGPYPMRLYETGASTVDAFRWALDGWRVASSPLTGLSAVVDLVAPHPEPWIDPLMRLGPPPNPCVESSVGLVSTHDGRVHEMRYRRCGAYDAWDFRLLRFDVAATADPGAPLIGAALQSTGDVIAVTGGDAPRAYRASGSESGIVVQEVGPVGDDPRMVRARGPIAVVASHGSDRIDVVLHGDVVATSPVGAGPTSVDLRSRDGGGAFALTTGGVDGTVTITEIGSAGQIVSTATQSLPAGWSGELSGAWLHDPDFTYVIGGEGRAMLFVGRR